MFNKEYDEIFKKAKITPVHETKLNAKERMLSYEDKRRIMVISNENKNLETTDEKINKGTTVKSKFKLTRQHLQGAVAMFLVCLLGVSVISVSGNGNLLVGTTAKTGSTKVDYAKDEKGNNIGIKTATIAGTTYYDLFDGKKQGDDMKSRDLYKEALNKKDSTANNASALNYWSQLAYLIFEDNSDFTSYSLPKGNFEKAFGNNSTSEGYGDLVADFQQTKENRRGKVRKDNTWYSGLSYETSLANVRENMADSIATGIGRKIKGSDVLKNTDKGNALKIIDDDTKQDVLYTMVTGINKVSGTYQYEYNSFGLAFYDFTINVLADENLQYVTAAEGQNSLEEAAANNIPGVTYKEIDTSDLNPNYVKNESKNPANVDVEYSTGTSTSISNSVTDFERYVFSETIGMETKFSAGIPLIAKNETSLKIDVTTEQIFTTEVMNGKEVTDDKTKTLKTSITLPPQTAINIDTSDGIIKMTLDYDCPVSISYKVSMFSLSGTCYDDSAAVKKFNTAGYYQKHFCTTFGDNNGSAKEDLQERINESGSSDKALGNTYGWSKNNTVKMVASETKGLNWNSITSKSVISTKDTVRTSTLTNWLTTHQPMSAFGSNISTTTTSMNSTLHPIVPLYPLNSVKFDDLSTKKNLEMHKNETLNLSSYTYKLEGYNSESVPFYGFNTEDGRWIIVDEKGNILEDSKVAYISTDSSTKEPVLTATGTGMVRLKYVIDEDKYISQQNTNKYATNSSLKSTAYLEIKVTNESFSGSVEVQKEISGVKGEVVELNSLPVNVYDNSGKEISVDQSEIIWEQKNLKGLTINSNETLTLDETGTYSIRANYRGTYSNWINVSVSEQE